MVEALIQQGRKQAEAGIIAALEGMINRVDHQDTLKASPCPVLFLGGELDTIVPPEWNLKSAHLPDIADVHLLAGVGHMAMFEAPEQTADILLRFWHFCENSFK